MKERTGWAVFSVGGLAGRDRLEIQRDDETGRFGDDLAALRFVIHEAAHGNEDAERALYAVNFQDFEGWEDWNA